MISEAGSKLSILFSLVVVGGKVVVVVFLSFFFPFLSVFGFLVALGSFGSLFFFLSFFFFLSSSGALLTRPKISGKKGKKRSGRERERGFPEPTPHSSVTKSFEMKTYSSLHTEAKDTISSFMRLGSEIMQLFLHCITLQCFQEKSRLPITFQWLLEVHQYFLLTFPQVLWHLHGNHVSLFPLVVLY